MNRDAPRRDEARRRRARLPETLVVQVTGTDRDGDAIGRPADWKREDGVPPLIMVQPEKADAPALAPGERVLAHLRPAGPNRYHARTIRRLSETPARVLGVFRHGRAGNRVIPTDRRSKAEWLVPAGQEAGAEANELVLAEPIAQRHHLGLKPVRVIERLGPLGDARSISLIAIHTHDIPQVFPEDALQEAKRARATRLGNRTDLRGVPLTTIDGADARDFDDAVFAEPDHHGGFRLIVAIADVAHYVKPDSALDRAARQRGNSVYFPDRVVPMLPEALSNGWCSLRPHEDRGCLFVEMRIDRHGRKTSHSFGRGLMRSAARLTYEEVQAAHDAGNDLGLPLPALYAAFRALLAARQARGTLDLDLPERQIVLDKQGRVVSVAPRQRLDSHRLIEEFMVLANVAAAEELERLHRPCMYRVHAPPSDDKLDTLRDFLATLGISLKPGSQIHPRDLDDVLQKVAGSPEAMLVNEVMLRSQSQAAYSPDNIGHFGLALPRYAHFTSPIRRYADLLVHRSLIKGLRLGRDGLADIQAAEFPAIAEAITETERRAQVAERDSTDRYLAAFMATRVGAQFDARISGVTRHGLFVTLTETGASGMVPFASLPDDYWEHDDRAQTLTGRRSRIVYRLGQAVEARLSEANPITGGLQFHIVPEPRRTEPHGPKGHRRRPKGDRDKGEGPNRDGLGKRPRHR
ncbi:MAG TPA: ribonuclease R [Rhodopila sp.]|uniref:ribonuclease R n=1 Tax=Rhodopila sp. TaxID=2480087 RepID=UPI002C7CF2F5|nr:ribonuclease R [Rhodopila sp.]HVY17724.1 ribonuclease R [Rhodopila sp.]